MGVDGLEALVLKYGSPVCIHRGKAGSGGKSVVEEFLVFLERVSSDFSFCAYVIRGGEARLIAACHSYLDTYGDSCGSWHPHSFLNLPEIPTWQALYGSDIRVVPEYQGQGLGSCLLELLSGELMKRKAFHVVAFTDAGRKRLGGKFSGRGYSNAPLQPGAEVPSRLSNLSDWMFFDYSKD